MRIRLTAVVALSAAAAVFIGACGHASPGGPIVLSMPSPDLVVASGLSSAETAGLTAANLSADAWSKVLWVSVAGAKTPVAGRYAVGDDRIEFRPAFPFDAGRVYDVALIWDAMPVRRSTGRVAAALSLTSASQAPVTRVLGVHPTAEQWPANLLRAYIHFSGPMGRDSGVSHVVLRDEHGAAVPDAFLPLESDFWNADHTRYTVFFDPGRVKRGILPNRDMGRALVAGRQYTLEIAATWRDAQDRPLVGRYQYRFQAGPAIEAPLDIQAWVLATPSARSRDPLVVTFPWPIDHGLSLRALSISGPGGVRIAGEASLAVGDKRWSFEPRDAWIAGEYQLMADPILEDPSGNQIGRAFEVDGKAKPIDAPHSRVFQITKKD